MAEQTGDKTEAPTPRKREQAAEQGNVARSQDLVAAALVVGAMMLLKSYGSNMIGALRTLVEEMLGSDSLSDLSAAGAKASLGRAIWVAAAALVPLLVGLVVIATLGNLLQVGLKFNTKKLQPNFAALNPIKGIGQLFGGKNAGKAAMNLAKFLVVAFVAYSAIHDRLPRIVKAQELEFLPLFDLAASTVYSIALRIGVALLILAILDYAWQRYRMEQELKMTKQEVKDEMRSMEGDPKMKMRRRQIAMQIARGKMRKDVPTADVVVTNPTEFAIALKYDGDAMHAPKVVAKGRGPIAALIREIAIANGIPILERKPLARALFRLVDVGQEIPEQFYSAVAEILAYVYELNRKVNRRAAS